MKSEVLILTSAEDKVIKGRFMVKDVKREGNYYIWTFPNEEAANHAVEVFHNSNFIYVGRLV